MKKRNKFTVTCPNGIARTILFLFALVVVLLVLNTIFSKPPHYPMYITATLFVFIPFSIPLLWLKLFKVIVNGHKITIRKGNGIKYSFDVSEIEYIKWIVTGSNNYMPQLENIRIKTESGKKFAIDTAMDGFDEMSAYIKENVDESKIETRIRKKLARKTNKT